ncbi:MAG: ATP-dependent helicase [Spirochaetes bacterium]|nr:ATP-dependent helicase [Spirochaetota bacterium]
MDTLNSEQQMAAGARGGISMVLAGAGTGKTRTIIEKVCGLIRSGFCLPEAMLVLTFSRKAAEELRRRIAAATCGEGGRINAATFHSFALSLLRQYGEEYLRGRGYARFPSVMEDEEGRSLITELAGRGLKGYLGMPLTAIIDAVSGGGVVNRRSERRLRSSGLLERLDELRRYFAEEKIRRCLIDFDEIMRYAVALLEERRDVRDALAERFRYLLVDEFQDTSAENFRLLELLLPDTGRNLFVVGDDWQSIYGFRDARVEYMVRLKRYFPSVAVHRLTVNYRSRREIVSVASRFIRKNRFRTSKHLRSHKGRGGQVMSIRVEDHAEEAAAVAGCIRRERSLGEEGTLAVLFRNNWQGAYLRERIPEELLRDSGTVFMTMHASKGLEFTAVIIAGIADSIIPDPSTSLEEERRLFYVAMTRAEERLYLLWQYNDLDERPRFIQEIQGRYVSERVMADVDSPQW